jgi:putative ABC transport system permease protein
MSAVLAEAVLVGAVASAVGVVAGLVAARGLLSLMGAAGLTLPSASVVFRPRTAAAGMIAGVLVTAAAAIQPARRAARVTTLAATGGGHEPAGRRRRRLAVALAVTVVGVGELLTGLYGDPPRPLLAVAIGAALLLSGMSLLVPFLVAPAARLAGAPLVALFGEPARLGRQNAVRSPRRTAATASALMIGITLIGVVAILAASMKASARTAIESAMRSDFAITANSVPGSSGSVPPQVASRLRGVPQVAAVSEIRTGQWGLAGRTQTLVAVDPATVQRMYRLDAGSAAAAAALDDDGVLVRDSVAARQGWKVGDAVPMTFTRTGTRGLRLEGTYSTSTVRSDFVVSLHSFEANFAKQLDLEVDVLLAPGTASEGGRAAIRRALPDFPNLAVRNRSETLAAQEHEVDRVLVPVTALLVLSVVIALLGIANTLALAVHERVRELGLLRAVGMARSQLRTMIRSEAVITACTGAVLGVVVAAACGWIAASALASKGMTERVLPVGQLAALASVASLAGMAAAAMPARRAARMAVLDAVSAD